MNLSAKRLLDYYVGSVALPVLKLLMIVARQFIRRNHDLRLRGDIVVLKLLGGGSLVIAFPALLGIRRAFPNTKIRLVTTPNLRPFGEILSVFDEILTIDDSSLLALATTGIWVAKRCFLSDTVIDLEVHSRLTTAFCALTGARNRIGFYLDSAFWRRNLYTHLLFFNRFSGAYCFYDQICTLIGARPASVQDCRATLVSTCSHNIPQGKNLRICIGHGCSDLAKERMFPTSNWVEYFRRELRQHLGERMSEAVVSLVGGPSDRESGDKIVEALSGEFPTIHFENLSGRLELRDSIRVLLESGLFLGVDSSMLHFARILGVECVSFWGPTSPNTLLRPIPGLAETIHYLKIPCSPCVHVTEAPPCKGNNICMKRLTAETADEAIDSETFAIRCS